jgi:MurNAc alpha-1-phosphate uridylyltransferase
MFENGVILAAGRGVRMLPLSESIPKPLLPNPDDSLLKQQVNFMRGHVKNLFVTVGYMGAAVAEAALSFGADAVVDIGTGGNASWVHSSNLGLIESPTLIVTSDNVMEVDLGSLFIESERDSESSFIVAVERDSDYPGDRIITDADRISALGPSNTSSLLASGLQVIVPRRITRRNGPLDDFSGVWADLIKHKELKLAATRPTSWFAIDTPSDLEQWSISRGSRRR